MKRILVIGSSGQLAAALASQSTSGDAPYELETVARPDIDLARPETLPKTLSRHRFDLLINAAAYTAVDDAENDVETAWKVNATAPGVLAGITASLGVPIIHVSTDYVFQTGGPHDEMSLVQPQSVYGQSKLAGEKAVAETNSRHLILRTSWVFGPIGRNFLATMLRLAGERESIKVVDDQLGNPTSTLALAPAILSAALSLDNDDGRYGTYHLAGREYASWAQFAIAIMAASKQRGGPSCNVVPIASHEYPVKAKRPADSRLKSQRFFDAFGIEIPGYTETLGPVLDAISRNELRGGRA